MLNTLQPIANTVRARQRGFGEGIGMALVSAILMESGISSLSSNNFGGLLFVFCVSGVLLSLSTVRKVEWAYINSKVGPLSVTVARAGPSKDEFESFIQLLIRQIQIADQNSSVTLPR
jgi:hypothetical protein